MVCWVFTYVWLQSAFKIRLMCMVASPLSERVARQYAVPASFKSKVTVITPSCVPSALRYVNFGGETSSVMIGPNTAWVAVTAVCDVGFATVQCSIEYVTRCYAEDSP